MSDDAIEAAVRALTTAIRDELRREAPAVAPRAHSVGDAARLIGVSRAMLYRYVADGRLRTHRIGGRRVVTDAAIADFLDSGKAPG